MTTAAWTWYFHLATTCGLKPLKINLVGVVLSLSRKVKFLIIFCFVFEIKSPLGTQKFNLIQRGLDAKFDNSKLGKVRCKISLKFVFIFNVIIYVWYHGIYIQLTDWFSISNSFAPCWQSVLQIHALYRLYTIIEKDFFFSFKQYLLQHLLQELKELI